MLSEAAEQLSEWLDDNVVLKREFAESIDVSQQTLSHLLSGRRQATLEQAVRIERETDIEVGLWLK